MDLKLKSTLSTLLAACYLLVSIPTFANKSTSQFKNHVENELQEFIATTNVRAAQQQRKITIKGVVTDYGTDETLIGVSVIEKGTSNGVTTNLDGEYTLSVSGQESVIIFSYIGFEAQEITVGTKEIINVTLRAEAKALDEVVVVGFGKQRKESLVSSISTINVKELKGPTSNLTTMVGGRISGIISYQRSGEPGQDNAQFFVRGVGSFGTGKVDPLILIDGIESTSNDLARLQPDDISDFSVLKDATASAVYGARGANGVVLVNTKQGSDGSTKFNFRVENSVSGNTQNFKLADNITYMKLANEAALTRNPLAALPYSQTKIDYTNAGINPLLYPSNDWIDLMIKPYTANQRINMNITGGGKIARYYIAGTFNVDNGVLKDDKMNNFSNNVKLRNYSIRANNTLNLTNTTEAIVRVHGRFEDYEGPIGGGGSVFNSVLKANPVAFPVYYPTELSPYTDHIMFGNNVVVGTANVLYANPYANMVSGYQRYNESTINAQLELKQNLNFITEGLSTRGMAYVQRYSRFASQRRYAPFYYRATDVDGNVNLTPINDGGPNSVGETGREYLDYSPGDKNLESTYYAELALNYAHTFTGKHEITGMVIGTARDAVSSYIINGTTESLETSLARRNLGISGRFSYMFDTRYLVEFNFGYNGSERFSKENRWGFFPSIGGGWIVSNESFFIPLKHTLSNLKLRASYGLVGNDQIGNINDRFFYMSNVNLNDGGKGYTFGENYGYSRPGVSISRYANDLIGWEKSRQLNLGLDFTIKNIEFVIDAYSQKRSNILMQRSYSPGTMGLQSSMSANVGKANSQGIDVGVNYNKAFKNGVWTQLRANFTYATNKILVYDEPSYPEKEYYRSRVGYPINQQWGYIAERLFVDEYEVANSPTQYFGTGKEAEYGAGDIKYRDVNGDGVINEADMVPIGLPTTPEIIYGFGGSVGFKGFDISAFFQGSGRSSFFIEPNRISPFVTSGGEQNGLLNVIANNHWSEDNRNLYAFWPRLSNIQNNNNNQRSTWWMRNGAFLRLKTVEIGYNLPEKTAHKIGLSDCRFYMNANNLFSVSKFKLWDTEMGGNGLGYPIQKSYNIGVSFGI